MYENTGIGDWMKENSYRPGDLILVFIFSLLTISVLEYLLIGRDKEEDNFEE
jgi:hypothetical protein